MAASAAHRVLDTAAGNALHPQLLLEAHEVLALLDFQADKIDVQVELEVQPPGFKVLLRPQHPNHQPAGLAITYQGLRHVNSSGWIFGKELHGTCCCGARITSANPSQFKELVAAHIHGSREQASSPAQPASTACPAPSMEAPAGPMDIDGENNPAAQDAADAIKVKQEPGTQPTSNGPATSDSHIGSTAIAPPGGPSSTAPPAPELAGSSNGDMHGAHAGSQPACEERCRGWMSAADDSSIAEELKTLAVMLGAANAGYSELLQPDSVDPTTTAAYKAAAEAVLKDNSMRQHTCFLRPVRAPPSHLADATQRLELLPSWCRRALQVPFTQWTLAQPWYLHIPASRSHTGLPGTDMCLPARRAASRIRSELPALHAFDTLPRSPGGREAKQEPKVSEQVVGLKLQQLLKRTHDKRTTKQAAERLGTTMAQLCGLVNMKELGGQALDMCAWCGAHVRDPSMTVPCGRCVDVFHLSCIGLKQMPLGEWICPCCTLASGESDSAAAAALAIVQGSQCARSRMSSGHNDTALPPGSALRAVPIQHAIKTSGLGVNKPSPTDGVSTGEAGPSTTATSPSPSHRNSHGQEASLPPMPVAARPPLQHYVGRGRGGALGGRGGMGVGGPRNMPPISTPPLGMPPLGGGGSGSGASNAQQQQQRQQQSPSAAAAKAAGGALREGSSDATRKPTPPAASPAQGGLEALAAARAQGFASLNARAQQQQQQQQQQRPSPAKQHVHKQQHGPGSEHGVQGGGHAAMLSGHPPLPHLYHQQLQHLRRHAGVKSAHEQQAQQGEGHLASNHFTHHNNTRTYPPNALPNNAHASAARMEGAQPSLLPSTLVGLPPAEGGDPSLYRTGLANLPQPSAMGRALCARLAKELVEQKVTPGSSKWRPQTLLSLNLLEGATCEYHHNVNTAAVPTSLSDAQVVVGGIRCSNCRPLVGESNGPQVDESENLLASGPEPVRTNPAATKPLAPCGKTFARLIDYEQHLQMASGFAPVHIWLPKHCMYLQGFKGTRGLMELVAAEVYRSPALMSVCDPAAAAAAAAAQQHQLQQGGAASISQDLNDPSSTHLVSHQMPGMHVAVPPPRSLADRQKLARQVQLERRQRSEDEHALATLHPNKRRRQSKDAVGPWPSSSPPRVRSHPHPSSTQLQLQRQQLRLYQMQQLRMSEPRMLARVEPSVSAFHGGVKGEAASGNMYSLDDAAGGDVEWAPGEFGQEGGSEMVDETAADLLLAIAGRGQHPASPLHALPSGVHLPPPSNYPHAAGYAHSQHLQQLPLPHHHHQHLHQLPFGAGPHGHGQPSADLPPPSTHPLSSLSAQAGLPLGPSTSHHLPTYTQPPGASLGGVQGWGGPDGAAVAAAAAAGGVSNPATAARMASLKLMRRLSALSVSCRKDDSLAQAMFRTLKACREAASQISDAQLQLESMGFISDLLALTEEEVAALIKARQQQQQQHQKQQQHSCPGDQQGLKEEPEAQPQKQHGQYELEAQQQQPGAQPSQAEAASHGEHGPAAPASHAAPESSAAQNAPLPAKPAQASSKDDAENGAVVLTAAGAANLAQASSKDNGEDGAAAPAATAAADDTAQVSSEDHAEAKAASPAAAAAAADLGQAHTAAVAPADTAQVLSKDDAEDGAAAPAAAAAARLEVKAEEGTQGVGFPSANLDRAPAGANTTASGVASDAVQNNAEGAPAGAHTSADGDASHAVQNNAEGAPAGAHTSARGPPAAAPHATSHQAQGNAEDTHCTEAVATRRGPTPMHTEPTPTPAHRDPTSTPAHKEPSPTPAPAAAAPTPALAPAATKPSPASATPSPAAADAITASEDSKLPQLLADAEDLQAQLEDWAGIPRQRQKHAS